MSDPKTFWLVFTNVALGVVVGLLGLLILARAALEILARLRKRRAMWAELDRDMRQFFGPYHPRK